MAKAYDWKEKDAKESPKKEAEPEKAEPVKSFDCPHCGKAIAYEPAEDAKEEHAEEAGE
jgi:predicted RNA-binding Zn-ribbon protein involved in translation (DUF1610 family)